MGEGELQYFFSSCQILGIHNKAAVVLYFVCVIFTNSIQKKRKSLYFQSDVVLYTHYFVLPSGVYTSKAEGFPTRKSMREILIFQT